jgi:hypothetical protein
MSACYAVLNPTYQPAMRIVTAISQTNPAVVTTSFAHQYVDGIIVRLDVPLANGMQQISSIPYPNVSYPITVTGSSSFSIPVDATNFQAFTNVECCCVVPVGEINSSLNNATRNVLPY